ncbi:hypothetical protein MKW98_028371 [Papaver atlanticum]|uniref:Uncharacterized protein n=1 Tax=Papaver atlanticum TaxID=357466 RepID=A0AAD4SXQ4_9MAGN|nr:hypothetical protein MKW98_028371 [Papaver atlanticum]
MSSRTNSDDDRSRRLKLSCPRRRSTSSAVPFHSFHHQSYEGSKNGGNPPTESDVYIETPANKDCRKALHPISEGCIL